MALSNGAGGYQIGDGNLGEVSFYNTWTKDLVERL